MTVTVTVTALRRSAGVDDHHEHSLLRRQLYAGCTMVAERA
jgi:hypothetical protein